MIILGIDTSCDDTCIAIIRADSSQIKILSNIVSSQVRIHRKYGGVYPTLAKREHQRNLIPVLKKVLKESNFLSSKFKTQNSKLHFKIQNLSKILEREPLLLRELKRFLLKYQKPDIDFIATTIGPGLEPCLWQGINFAKALSFWWRIPSIPINHIEAHILANWLTPISSKFKTTNTKSQSNPKLQAPNSKRIQNSKFKIQNYQNIFPAIALVVSGGHTQLILVKRDTKSNFKYKILGETRDDAAGECLDKTARLLGLGYPGGPAIAAEAEKFKIQNSKFKIHLPRPMINQKNYDFSFSGLKTAVLYLYQKSNIKNQKFKQALAFEIQQAIIDVLIKKTIRAAKDYRVKSIMLGGGVAANLELRRQFKAKINSSSRSIKFNFFVPPEKFCTDNAAMVALAGFFHRQRKTKNLNNISARPNLRIS